MRIQGYGGGFSGDQSSDRRGRSTAQAFRRGRRIGQIVRGRLVAPAENGLVWVAVDGHTLLAHLDHPPSGSELLFCITALSPEVILRDITPPPGEGSDPVRLLASLTEARSQLESLIDALPRPSAPPPLDLTMARRLFLDALAANPATRTAWNRTRELTRFLSALLPPGEGRLHYTPWIFPGLGQSELLAERHPAGQDGPGFSLRLFGRLPRLGRLVIQAAWHPGQVRYRLLLEHPEAADAVVTILSRVRFGRAEIAPHCQSAGPLPDALAGGFLTRLLAGQERPFTGLRLQV